MSKSSIATATTEINDLIVSEQQEQFCNDNVLTTFFSQLECIYRDRDGEAERQWDRESDRQTDRQTDKQTNRQINRDTELKIDGETERQREKETEREGKTENQQKNLMTSWLYWLTFMQRVN